MTRMIQTEEGTSTNQLLAIILGHCRAGERVQFLVEPRAAASVIQRLRVALSRSRSRNKQFGRKIEEFTLRHTTHPYTDLSGKRHVCIVMWTEKHQHHIARELLDDIMDRES